MHDNKNSYTNVFHDREAFLPREICEIGKTELAAWWGGVDFRASRSVFQVRLSHLLVTGGQLIKTGLLCALAEIEYVGHQTLGQHITL